MAWKILRMHDTEKCRKTFWIKLFILLVALFIITIPVCLYLFRNHIEARDISPSFENYTDDTIVDPICRIQDSYEDDFRKTSVNDPILGFDDKEIHTPYISEDHNGGISKDETTEAQLVQYKDNSHSLIAQEAIYALKQEKTRIEALETEKEIEEYANMPEYFNRTDDLYGGNIISAVRQPNIKVLRRMTNFASVTTSRLPRHLTPYLYAAFLLKHEAIEIMAKSKHFKTDDIVNDSTQATALHLIALHSTNRPKDAMVTMKLLIEKYKCNLINTPDAFGHSPIFASIKSGDLNIMKYMVEAGADIDFQRNEGFNNTPLHFAMEDCNEDIIDFLLKNGANISLYNNANRLPIHEAAVSGCISGLRLLLKHQSDQINIATRNYIPVEEFNSIDAKISLFNATPLHHAALYGNYEAVDLLLTNGADPRLLDVFGRSAKIYASAYSFQDIIDKLNEFN